MLKPAGPLGLRSLYGRRNIIKAYGLSIHWSLACNHHKPEDAISTEFPKRECSGRYLRRGLDIRGWIPRTLTCGSSESRLIVDILWRTLAKKFVPWSFDVRQPLLGDAVSRIAFYNN
jgi:hypothetical protein